MSRTNRRTAAFYDTESETYDASRYSSKSGRRMDLFQKNVLVMFLRELSRNNQNLMELGCGTGRLMAFAAKQFGQITGIDVSKGMLLLAHKRMQNEGIGLSDLVRGDALSLPFPDENFDAVYSILVINLIPDHHAAISEVSRVLQTGGLFVFSIPNLSSIYFPIGLIVNKKEEAFGKNISGGRFGYWFSFKEINTALKSAGFKVEKVLGQPPWVRQVDNARPLPGGFIGRLFSRSLYMQARKI